MISLFGFDPRRPPAGEYALVDGTLHFLSATAAALIAGLARQFQLVWCSGWEERADEHLPARLGLPRGLAHLSFSAAAMAAETDGPTATGPARHWKLDAIDAFAGSGRPLAWVDDAHDHSCRAWASRRCGPTLLVVTDPAVGITDTHVLALEDWAWSLGRPAPGGRH